MANKIGQKGVDAIRGMLQTQAGNRLGDAIDGPSSTGAERGVRDTLGHVITIAQHAVNNPAVKGALRIGNAGVAGVAVDIATGKSANQINRNMVASTGGVIGAELAVVGAGMLGLGTGGTFVAAVGVGYIGSHIATGIYDVCRFIGQALRPQRPIPDSYVTYSMGRDPFTGQGMGIRTQMRKIDPMEYQNRQKLYQIDRGTSLNDNNNFFNNYSNKNDGYGGGPFGDGGGNGPFGVGGGGDGGGNSSFNGLFSSGQIGGFGGNSSGYNGSQSSYYGMICKMTEGYTSRSDFAAGLYALGLGSSYNSYNGNFSFPGEGNGQIGGVATKAGVMNNLLKTDAQIQNQWIISIKSNDSQRPVQFTTGDLQTILRQLSYASYSQNTFPFFSLHFNDTGVLFSVIHPAYQDTLIGQVISFLDYYMKGFLNGGIYKKQFLNKWHQTLDTNRQNLKPHLIDLGKQYKKINQQYHSLRQMMAQHDLEGDQIDQSNPVHKTKFQTSFRIISKVVSVQKYSNLLQVQTDFDVMYTIELMPSYKEYLEQYKLQHGKYPEKHMQIEILYKQMASQIKELMPKLPLFKRYFDLLKLITFASSYFATLKKMFKIPIFEAIHDKKTLTEIYRVPKAFPPIPVRYYTFHKLTIKLGDLLKSMNTAFPNQIDKILLDYFQTGQSKFTEPMLNLCKNTVSTLIKSQIHLPPNEEMELDQKYVNNVVGLFQQLVKMLVSGLEEKLINLCKELNTGMKSFSDKSQLISLQKLSASTMKKMNQKITYIKQVNQKFFTLKLKTLLQNNQKQKQQVIQKYNEQWNDYVKMDNKRKADMKKDLVKQQTQIKQTMITNLNNQLQQVKATLNKQANDLINAQYQKIVNPHLYAAQIKTWQDGIWVQVNTKIATVTTAIQTEKTNKITQLSKALVAAQKQNLEKWAAQFTEAQKKITQLKTQLNTQFLKIVEQNKKQTQKSKQQIIKILNVIEQQFKALTKTLLQNEKVYNINLTQKKYLNHRMTIAQAGYYKQVGQNFKIIGGCGLKMSEINVQTMNMAEEKFTKYTSISTQIQNQTVSQIEINGKKNSVFKIKCKNNFDFLMDQFSLLKNSSFIYDDPSAIQKFISKDQLQFLQKITDKNLINQNQLKSLKYNPEKQSIQGLKLGHIAVLSSQNSSNLAHIKHLFDKQESHGNYPIHVACSNSKLSSVQQIIKIDKKYLQVKNNRGLTPLCCSVLNHNQKMVQFLCNSGANVNYRMQSGMTPIMLAASRGLTIICKILLSKQCSLQESMPTGDTALHYSIRNRDTQTSLLITQKMISIETARNKSNGYNPFHQAAAVGNHQVLQLILKSKKVLPDSKTDTQETALHIAASRNYIECVQILVQKYATDVNALDCNGQTPLMKAIDKLAFKTAAYLAQKQKINLMDQTESNCSVLAAKNNMFEVLDILKNRGQNMKKNNLFGDSVQTILRKNGMITRYTAINGNIKIQNNAKISLCDIKQMKVTLANRKDQSSIQTINNIIDRAIRYDQKGILDIWLDYAQPYPKIQQKLKKACEYGSYRCVELIINKNHNQIGSILNENSILTSLGNYGSFQCYQILCPYIQNPNKPLDLHKNTLGHLVVNQGYLQYAKKLIKLGVKFNIPNSSNIRPIDLSIQNDDCQFLQYLIQTYPQQKIPSFFHKPQCSTILTKTTVGKLSISKCNMTSGKQISNKQKTILIQAVKSNNITLIQKMVNFGCSLAQKINNKYPIEQTIENNSFKTFMFILQNLKNDKNKVKIFLDPQLIKILVNNHRVLMLLQIFKFIDAKDRQLLKTNVFLKSDLKTNVYLQQAFTKGTNIKFAQDMVIIIESIANYNHKIFAQKIKTFPINQLVYNPKLSKNSQLKRPLLFFLYQQNFANGLSLVADRINPTIKDQNGFGLGALLIRESSHSKQLMQYTKKYFQKYLKEIFSQLSNGVALIELANILGKRQFIQELFNLSPILKASTIDISGNTLLHFAVKANNYEAVKLLLNKQFINNVDIKNNRKRTALSFACQLNLPHMVQLLLKNNANPNLTDLDGNTCLHYSFKAKNQDSFHKDSSSKLILNMINNIDAKNRQAKTALMLGQPIDDSSITKTLINKGANLFIKDNSGMEAIHYAAIMNKYQNIKALVQSGANINSQAKKQNSQDQKDNGSSLTTPSHFAALMGYQKILSYLYHNGADFNIKNSNNQTVYQSAIQSNNRNMTKLIRQIPVIFDDKHAISLLQACCKVDNYDALLMFIQQGFNLSFIDKDGHSLIHICAINTSIKCLSTILRRNISPNYRDSMGNLPVHYASQMNSITSMRLLLPYSAMNQQNSQGNTPLHIACTNNSEVLVRYMLMRRVSFKITNRNALTPGQIALMSGRKDIIAMFYVLGDTSLTKIQHLQEYFKLKIKQNSYVLNQINSIYEKQGKNMLLTSISLRNINALKTYLQLNLLTLLKHPNKALILQKAKIHQQSYNLISKYLKLYQGLDIKQMTKQQLQYIQQNLYKYDSQGDILQLQRLKSDQRLQVNVKNSQNLQTVYDSVRVIFQITQGSLKLFKLQDKIQQKVQLSKILESSLRQSTLFYVGIWNHKKQDRKKFILSIFEFLRYLNQQIRLKDEQFYYKIRQYFLIAYPWNLINQKVISITKEVFNIKNQNLKKWFLKYFQPLIIPYIEIQLQKAINLWNKFMLLLKKQPKNIQLLQKPPKFNISYCLKNAKHFQDCLNVLQKPPKYLTTNNLIKIKHINEIASTINQPKLSLILQHHRYKSYSSVLIQIQDFLLQNRPEGMEFIMQLQQSLSLDDNSKQKTQILNDQQKLILCKRCLDIIKVKQNSLNRISLFIEMAERVMKYLGKLHFYLLFYVQRAVKCGFSTYIRISQLMIDLQNPIQSLLLIQNSNTSLIQIQKRLSSTYIKYLQTKFPQKSQQMIKKDFTTKSQLVKYPLLQAQYQQYSLMYNQIQKQSSNISTLSNQDIQKKARQLALTIKQNIAKYNKANILKAKVQLIAILRQQIRRIHKIFPYNTQIYVLIILLGGQQIQNSKLKGRIGQIRTGQGKSTIVVMLAAYLALQGDFVDVITSSPYLAIRDQAKYKQFFNSLGLTCCCISVREGAPAKQKFNGMVLFGTNYDFQFSIMRDEIYNYGNRRTQRYGQKQLSIRPCECVIVDQVDSLFVDMAFNSARLATKSPFHVSWAYEIIYKYVKECIDTKIKPNVKIMRTILQQHDNQKYKDDVDGFQDQKIERWMQRAEKAIVTYQQNRQYIIRINENTGEREVIIVDLQNTGRLKIGSRWSQGLHQFVQVKHGIKPKDQSLTIASISHPAFFQQYKRILGVSGTMGTEEERIQITKIYNVDIKDVPPHFPSLRWRQPLKITHHEKFYEQIILEINEIKKFKRPVLIIFKSIQQSNQFSTLLTKKGLAHFTLNEAQKEHQSYIISKAGRENALTIATNTAGRGTDIILSPESKKNGGLHVIIAFYPVNSRVEDQGLGRSGRQGQKGTCKVFTHFKDAEIQKLTTVQQIQNIQKDKNLNLQNMLDNMRTKKISQLSNQRLSSAISQNLKYQILHRFCNQLSVISQLIKEKNQKVSLFLNMQLKTMPLKRNQMKSLYSKLKYEISQLSENPLIQNFSKILSEHIGHLAKKFISFGNNKQPFIQCPSNYNDGIITNFLKLQIDYIIQQWSIFYSNDIIGSVSLNRLKMEHIWNKLSECLLNRYKLRLQEQLRNQIINIYLVSVSASIRKQIKLQEYSRIKLNKAQPDKQGWIKVWLSEDDQIILCHDGKLTVQWVSSIKIKDVGWSDDENTMKTKQSWWVQNVQFNSAFSQPAKINLPTPTVLCNVLNGLTPSGTAWSAQYSQGLLYYKGIMRTYGQFDKFYQGNYYGKEVYYDIGKVNTLRSGGWPHHTGQIIHTNCNDYRTTGHSISMRVGWKGKRVMWIRIKQ